MTVPALPGCFTQGDTYEEAVEMAREAIACHLQKGSHLTLRHPDGRKVTIPIHSGTAIKRSLFKAILRQVGMTEEKFRELI